MSTQSNARAGIAARLPLVVLLAAGPVWAAAHVRGTISAVKDGVISVQTAKGDTEEIKVAPETGLFLVSKTDLSAVTNGKFVGVTSVEQGGKRVAREVHVFAELLRGLAEGHYPWDLDKRPQHDDQRQHRHCQRDGRRSRVEAELQGRGTDHRRSGERRNRSVREARPGSTRRRPQGVLTPKNDSKDAAAVVIGAEGVKPPM